MNTNLSSDQSIKNKFTSWIMGIVSIALAIFAWTFFMFFIPENISYAIPGESWADVVFFYYLGTIIIAILGLIFGIKELRLSKKIGLFGIVLSLVALILAIILGLWLELSIFARTT